MPMQRAFSSNNEDISVDQFLHEVSGKVNKWRDLADEEVVHPNETPEEIRKAVDLSIGKKGVGLKGILDNID